MIHAPSSEGASFLLVLLFRLSAAFFHPAICAPGTAAAVSGPISFLLTFPVILVNLVHGIAIYN